MQRIKTKICDFDDLSLDKSILKLRAFSSADSPSVVVTPNIDHLARLVSKYDENLLSIYKQASLCLCDSKILQKLLRLKGIIIQHVIPGSTLTETLFERELSANDRVTIIGGEIQVIDKLRAKFPTLNIQHYNPPMGFINNDEEVNKTIQFCINSDPNFTFLAVGSPRQEILADKLAKTGKFKGAILCIGASILFLVDEEKRAPLWMQEAHLEWFYRMMQDPGRLAKRYGANFLYLYKIYKYL